MRQSQVSAFSQSAVIGPASYDHGHHDPGCQAKKTLTAYEGRVKFQASYTYNHALDESTASPGSVVNPYNIGADYGNSDMDIPNRFVASATYELPFRASGKLNPFVQGWQVNTILQYYDGFPFSVSASSGVGDGLTPRAQLVAGHGNGCQQGHRPDAERS
jgi:hypothetical protein